MSNTGLIIEERSRDIGDFLVGRLIPFRQKRMVGPFIFIDHMGPTELGPHQYMDVDQHPHIGLSTLTYLMEGEIRHQDGIGTDQVITPGAVNWMVAGKGVTHTERTPQALRDKGKSFTMHGYQIWVALPKDLEDLAPSFHHFEPSELPKWEEQGARFQLIAGTGYGHTSPVPVHSDLFMVDVVTTQDFNLNIKDHLKGEIGITVVTGGVWACGQEINAGNMLVSKTNDACEIKVKAGSHLLLFGGKAFPEERHIYWNFVSHSKEKIEHAKSAWEEKSFPMMENDDTYVSLPK
ncbi:pirin family protein [Nonlabens xiamenensis]|uniref:pirin family protein n=1 Tax=Nonlabens xiamenensis TaxID=2341043 RepID=UPI000F60BEA4|nr:pirin family protein [Nonlabens xiamenensis]